MAGMYASNSVPTTLPTHELLGFKPDESVELQVTQIAQAWLTSFELASKTVDSVAFADLFAEDSFWRDIIAFTNDYRTLRGANIAQCAKDRLELVAARDVVFAATPPSLQHPFEDVSFINFHFDFATSTGPSYGIANLIRTPDGKWRAYLLFTLLEGIHGHPEKVGLNRARGIHNDKESYDTRRAEESEFKESEPSVLIVGAGHNGLSLAARLKYLGTEAVVIDKQKRTGDNWRLRYKSLSLHDPVYANHLAYMPFPPTWPIFTPAGKLANWMEHYVDVLELNVWNESVMAPEESDYDPAAKKWNVTILRGDGSKHKFSVTHVVLATGLGGGAPKMPPPYKGQESYTGKLVHSSGHGSGADWKGRKALVVGACTSAHDASISMDLINNGVDTMMLQRSPTYVMSVKNGMPMMMGGLYCEGGPDIDLADKMAESTPKLVVKLMHERIIPKLAALDSELLNGLAKAGFQTTLGPQNSGFIMMALEKAGGYYFDTGASGKIASGDIKVKQGEISHFDGADVHFKDGSVAQPDTVIFATGYTGFPDTVRATLGTKWTKNMSTVWSLDDEGELKGAYRESGIPNMFFLVGNLSAARMHSKTVALQIKAQQLSIFGERYTMEKQGKAQTTGVH